MRKLNPCRTWLYLPSWPQSRSDLSTAASAGSFGRDRAALAAGAEVLAGIEAEAAHFAEGPGPHAAAFGAMGLRRVLDDGEPVPPRDLRDRVHVGEPAVQVHGKEGPRPRRDRRLDRGRVHRPGHRIDVHEDRGRPGVDDRGHRRDEGRRHGDHLVPWADPRASSARCSAAVPELTAMACPVPQ